MSEKENKKGKNKKKKRRDREKGYEYEDKNIFLCIRYENYRKLVMLLWTDLQSFKYSVLIVARRVFFFSFSSGST